LHIAATRSIEFTDWVVARAWTSGDGPKAIFCDGMAWLRDRKVLLPGVTTLARLVAKVRDDTTRRLWQQLEGLLTPAQRYVLDQLLEVPPGSRVSDLERWRKGPPPRGSGPAIIKALDQVAEIMALGLADLGVEALVPPRRLGELAKYEMSADAFPRRRGRTPGPGPPATARLYTDRTTRPRRRSGTPSAQAPRSAGIPTAGGLRRCWPRSGTWRPSRSTTPWSCWTCS
jgi:hypothetical protein